MRKISFLLFIAVVFTACSQSPEQKAQKLVEEQIKKSLYHPETYEAVETVLDSAFAPKDDPAVYEKALKLCKLAIAAQEYDEKMKHAKSSMAIWSGPYMSAYGRNEYNEAKEEYELYEGKLNEIKGKIEKVYKDIEKLAEPGRHFIGFKVTHKYRANNNSGNTLIGNHVFLLDEKLENILAEYDADGEEYQMVQALFRKWIEEAEDEMPEDEGTE